METIAYKVNNGNINLYKQGGTAEMFKAGQDLISRAKNAGYRMTRRSQGNVGVHITYTNGKNDVTLYFFYSQNEIDMFNFCYKPIWNNH